MISLSTKWFQIELPTTLEDEKMAEILLQTTEAEKQLKNVTKQAQQLSKKRLEFGICLRELGQGFVDLGPTEGGSLETSLAQVHS